MKNYLIGFLLVSTFFFLYSANPTYKEWWNNLGRDLDNAIGWQKIKRGAGQGANFLNTSLGDSGRRTTTDITENRWHPLPDAMPLDKAMFVGTHNSYSHGPVFAYRQHVWTMEQQIEHGARGLMLDTFAYKNDVYLCHAECAGARAFSMTLNSSPNYRLFTDALRYIEQWLEKNPSEIIFIFLENYVKGDAIDLPIEQTIKNKDIIMTEFDWNEWGLYEESEVTIGELREFNKRLFIFNENATTKWTMNQWNKVIENNFSTVEVPRICGERGSSKKYDHMYRPLFLMNLFQEITATQRVTAEQITSMNIQKIITACEHDSTSCFKKNPNFIFVDHLQAVEQIKKRGEADIFDFVNEVNEKTFEQVLLRSETEQREVKQRALLRANPKDLTEIRDLLEHGADPNVIDNQGFTPLMRVIMAHNCGRYEADPSSSYQECVKNPGKVKELCQTIELFFKKGAQWDIKDDQRGWTAYDYARYNGMTDSYLYPFVPLLRGQPMTGTCTK